MSADQVDAMFPEWNESMVHAGRTAKAEALGRVEKNAEPDRLAAAYSMLIEIARARPEFTTDPLLTLAKHRHVPLPRERRALVAVMNRAVKSGICVPIQDRIVPSVWPPCHRRKKQVYRSLLYCGPQARSHG